MGVSLINGHIDPDSRPKRPRKLTILVDFDDVMNNFSEEWIKALNEIFHKNVKHEEITDWDICKFFPDYHKLKEYPTDTEEFWSRVKPKEDAVKYIYKLFSEGHRVVVVTASYPTSVPVKLMRVLPYFPFLSYKDVIVSSQKDLIKGDVLIDDGVHNLKGGTWEKILMTMPHNKDYDAEANGMRRVDNWCEVYSIIKEIIARREH